MTNQQTELKVKMKIVMKDDAAVIRYNFVDRVTAHKFIVRNNHYLNHNIPQLILN